MESAIPSHLRVARSRRKQGADDFEPPFPSYTARYKPNLTRVVMAYFGVQFRDQVSNRDGGALKAIAALFAGANGPGHWDRASYMDEAGFTNVISVAYWDDVSRFDKWFEPARAAWTGDQPHDGGVGKFIEVLRPTVEGYETLSSTLGYKEGMAALADHMSGEIQEHGYWGGMRDRLPLSQTDEMTATGTPRLVREGDCVRVVPHDNLCLIRSGQNWIEAGDEERTMYMADIEPILRDGMDFLRDEGASIGCIANRYMRVVGTDGAPIAKAYGMSWWKSIAALEQWAESHPTHVKIFGAAMKYMVAWGANAKMRFYHEVTVARASDQFFEYKNCHDRTGMLKSADQALWT